MTIPPIDPQTFGTMLLQALITGVGTIVIAIITGLVIFRRQKQFDDKLGREFEKFKNQLSAELQKDLIRLSTTYPKRVEIVDALHSRLSRVERCLDNISDCWPTNDVRPGEALRNESVQRLKDAFNEYKDFAFEKAIYLPNELVNKLVEQNKFLFSIVLALQVANLDDDGDDLKIPILREHVSDYQEKFYEISVLIRGHLRELLEGEKDP